MKAGEELSNGVLARCGRGPWGAGGRRAVRGGRAPGFGGWEGGWRWRNERGASVRFRFVWVRFRGGFVDSKGVVWFVLHMRVWRNWKARPGRSGMASGWAGRGISGSKKKTGRPRNEAYPGWRIAYRFRGFGGGSPQVVEGMGKRKWDWRLRPPAKAGLPTDCE